MTEQEKRDKAIEEMAKILGGCKKDTTCKKCEFSRHELCYLAKVESATTLYDAGYRQEEEVRKERTKEIFTTLIDACRFDGHTVNLFQSEIVEFAKQFGMEVEK